MVRRRNNRKTPGQRLNYPFTFVTGSGAFTTVLGTLTGVNALRPTKPVSLQLTFFSTVARSFTLVFFGGNGEEIFRSPVIMSGPIPRSRTFTFPANTDFSLYAGTNTVLTVNHATNPAISFTANWMVAHSNPTATVFL